MEMRWVYFDKPESQKIDQLSLSLNINKNLSQLLLQRGIQTFDQAKTFFRPNLGELHDPFLMKDMHEAVNRLTEAVSSQEKILIYGDYDVDGTTSVALVYSFLEKVGASVDYYIPDRYTEGYGISTKGIEWAATEGFRLIIALDCGITAIDQAKLASTLGIDLIICDHHLPGSSLPETVAVLDPKRSDCSYPFKELSGCGVGFTLLRGFCIQQTVPIKELFEYLDLVAVSIASDIVPIVGENRVLAHYGLKKLNQSPGKGLQSLMEISGLKIPVSISDVVFYIGPRINATGRLSHANDSVRLLISKDDNELSDFSGRLNTKNAERRDFDRTITSEALSMIESDANLESASSTVLFKNDWHKGVVGIVASRCIEHYYRPTIILTESNGKATGSARSVDGFNIYKAIASCGDLLEQFGGHAHAAGLSLDLDKVEIFQKRFEEVVSSSILPDQKLPKISVDLKVNFSFISFKTQSIIQQMAPFGPQNLQPIFVSERIKAQDLRVLKGQHLKFLATQKDHKRRFEAIAFGMAHLEDDLKKEPYLSIAYHIDQNEYRGNKTLQLNIKDIKID